MNKQQEISYTIGRLASKLGMSITPLRRHLEESGLIADCYYDEKGWLRIPYSTALSLTGGSASTLAIPTPHTRRKGRKRVDPEVEQLFEKSPQKEKRRTVPRPSGRSRSVSPTDDRFAYYQEVGKMLAQAGVTVKDLMSMYVESTAEERRQQRNVGCPPVAAAAPSASESQEEATGESQQNHHSGDEDARNEQGQS